MSSDNWWRGPRSSCQSETSGETSWPHLSPSRKRSPWSKRTKKTPSRKDPVAIPGQVERNKEYARSADRPSILDDVEFPELGQKTEKRKLAGLTAFKTRATPTEDPDRINLRNGKRSNIKVSHGETARNSAKKARRIAEIDVLDFAKRQRSVTESQTASCAKLPRGTLNLSLSIRNPLDSGQVFQCNREKQKSKYITKFKRAILREREWKRQMIVRMRDIFDVGKVQAMSKNVSEIDFDRLKISGDSYDGQTEVNFVRNMSSMTLFDSDYRKPKSDCSVADNDGDNEYAREIVRCEVTGRLKNHLIQRNRNAGPLLQESAQIRDETDLLDSDMATKALCLKICDETGETVEGFEEKPKIPRPSEMGVEPRIRHSKHFREYCTNDLTTSLNAAAEGFLAEVYRLQCRMYERDEVKGRTRRRSYAGFKEVLKHVQSRKIRFVVIAPDLEGIYGCPGELDELVDKLITTCNVREIVFCYALNKRKLGYLTHKRGSVSCVGIASYCGLEELFAKVLSELMLARASFEIRSCTSRESGQLAEDHLKKYLEETLLSARINLLFRTLTITT